MCMMRPPAMSAAQISAAQPLIAAPDNREAIEQGRIEARLRRLRAGAAANILTSPTGIPAVAQLGQVAA